MLLQRYHEMNKLFRKVEIEEERIMEEKNSLKFSTNDANAMHQKWQILTFS